MKSKLPNQSVSFLRILILWFLCYASIGVAKAATRTTTTTGGNWNATTTWVGGLIPSSSDDVIIGINANVRVTANATCNSITFATAGSGSTTSGLSVDAGITLTVTTLIAAPKFDAGIKGNTTYNISGGGVINCATLTVGINQSPEASQVSTLTLNSAISSLNVTGNTTLYSNAGTSKSNNAYLNINSGTVTINGTIISNTLNSLATSALTLGSSAPTLVLGNTAPFSSTGSGTFTTTLNGTGATVNYNGAGQTVRATSYTNLTLSGTGTKTITTGTTNVSGILSREGTAAASAAVTWSGSAYTLRYKGSAAQITGPEFTTPFGGSGGIDIENSNGVTLSVAKNIQGNPLTIGGTTVNSIFNDGGYQLSATGSLYLTSGTYNVTYSSFPAFTTTNIATGTTVNYSATATQTIKGLTYSNLTISGTGTNSKTADNNITVNGILNIASSNYSGSQGCLHMSSYTLDMGAAATTTGTGDVTGSVRRTSFLASTPYTFGNQYTTFTFASNGGLPSTFSVSLSMGTAPTWSGLSNALQRKYTLTYSSTTAPKPSVTLHYLDVELNSNTESQLVSWYSLDGTSAMEGSSSDFNPTDNYITFNASAYISTGIQLTLGNTTNTSKTWTGTTSTDWSIAGNWSPSGAPISTSNVIIPSGTTYIASLPASAEIKSISLLNGAVLNAVTSAQLTLNGTSGTWNNDGGTFNSGTSTIIFTGTSATVSGNTNFNSITISSGTRLSNQAGSVIGITGTVSNSGTWSTSSQGSSTVNYNGGDQTVIIPDAATNRYYNLILSGTGTKTIPSALSYIEGSFELAGSASTTLTGALTIVGNVTIGSGTTLAAGSYTHNIAGNWINNGGTFTPGSSSIVFNSTTATQAIQGTSSGQTFNNLIINKTAQSLSTGGSTNSLTINNLTLTSGAFIPPATLNISGNLTNNGATFTAGSGTVNFNGSATQTIGGTTSNIFNNLTVGNAAGVTSSLNQTVNGILTLGTNSSPTKGSLDMGSNALTMGGNSTTTGSGDVTGIVTRTSFITNTPYTFGNQYTTINFTNGGTLPASLTFKIILSGSDSWITTGKIKRYYDIKQTGGDASAIMTLNLHYLDAELNGATEGDLALFDYDVSPPLTEDQGSSNFNSSSNWVGLANLSLTYVAQNTFDMKYWIIGTSVAGNDKTWTGTTSTDWSIASNWSGGIPDANSHVHIPNTTNDPTLPASTTIGMISIEPGGVLNGGTGTILNIAGAAGAWDNLGTFNAGTSTVIFTNAAATMADPTDFNNVTIADGAKLTLGTDNIMRIGGTLSLSNTGVLNAATNHNTVEYYGASQTIVNPNGSTPGYHSLILSGSGTKTMPATGLTIFGDLTLSGTASVSTAQDITIAGNWSNTSSGSFMATAGTVDFNGSTAQTISGTNTFNTLTVTNSAGLTANANQTVNGTLNLSNANPSSTTGALNMGAYTLTMGANATTAGTGDVTGIITRNSIVAGTSYSFGNQYTTLNFQAGGTLPTSVSAKIVLAAPSPTDWRPSNGINRYYSFIQTGGTAANLVTLNLHYLTSELVTNGMDETTLDVFDYDGVLDDHGKSNYSSNDKWVGLANEPITYLAPHASNFALTYWTLGQSTLSSKTWIGGTSTSWNAGSNWSNSTIPDGTDNVIIPQVGSSKYNPTLDITTEVKSMTIQSGGVLTGGSATLTINGATGAWSNMAGESGFIAGTSTIIFTNAAATMADPTNFNNVTIATGARLTLGTNNIMRIAGTLSLAGTGILDAGSNENTIEFNGPSQSVLNPNGSVTGYHNLILSGSGTKTLPVSLNLRGNFTNNSSGTVDVTTNSTTVTFSGTSNQNIDGSSSTSFKNLTINNNYGVTLGTNETVTGTLTFSSGLITTGGNILTLGSTNNAGTITGQGDGKYVNGNLVRYVPDGAAQSVTFDIGDASNYTPVTVLFAGITSGSGYLQASTIAAKPPIASTLSQSKYVNRKWTITNTGVGGFTSYSPTFTFVSSDIQGSADYSKFKVAEYSSSGWSNTALGTLASTATQSTGVSTFGDFYIGELTSELSFSGTGDWATASNWSSNTVPTFSDDVTIPIGTSVVINSITAATCNNLDVAGTLQINSDASSNGSLIVNGTSTGNVTYNRWMDAGRWYIVSSPVKISGSIGSWLTGKDIPFKVDNGTYFGMTTYSELLNTWGSYYSTDTTTGFKPGKGYLLRKTSAGTIPFTGTINTSPVNFGITRTIAGWNSVGNPFTSSIGVTNSAASTDNFLSLNYPQLDPNYAAIYVYTNPGYSVINNSGLGSGYYTGTLITDKYVQAGQGFLVKSKTGGGQLTFTGTMCYAQPSLAFRSAEVSSWSTLILQAVSGGITRTTSLGFRSDMTNGLDPTYDAGIFKSDSNFEIYTRLIEDNGVDFSVQCLPTDNWTNLSIPVGIDFPLGGEVVFSISSMDIPSGYYPLLTDKLLNTSTYLKTSADNYIITLPANTSGAGRFSLSFGEGSSTGTHETKNNAITSLKVFPNPSTDIMNVEFSGYSGDLRLQIVNIHGSVVRELKFAVENKGRHIHQLNVNSLSKGLYLINAISGDGSQKTATVIIGR